MKQPTCKYQSFNFRIQMSMIISNLPHEVPIPHPDPKASVLAPYNSRFAKVKDLLDALKEFEDYYIDNNFQGISVEQSDVERYHNEYKTWVRAVAEQKERSLRAKANQFGLPVTNTMMDILEKLPDHTRDNSEAGKVVKLFATINTQGLALDMWDIIIGEPNQNIEHHKIVRSIAHRFKEHVRARRVICVDGYIIWTHESAKNLYNILHETYLVLAARDSIMRKIDTKVYHTQIDASRDLIYQLEALVANSDNATTGYTRDKLKDLLRRLE